jgi:phenylacetate-CoA ligase
VARSKNKLNLVAVDIYGLSEVMGPGVAMECHEAKKGLHIFEDHFIPEIIDPETGEVLPYGETGELVFTSITKEAFPVIRYRTRDITSLNPEPCICGRTHVRMRRVTGRSDDMLIIRGVNVFPSQIESVLMEMERGRTHYQLIVDREGNVGYPHRHGRSGGTPCFRTRSKNCRSWKNDRKTSRTIWVFRPK